MVVKKHGFKVFLNVYKTNVDVANSTFLASEETFIFL
jgi:hypothetical protein